MIVVMPPLKSGPHRKSVSRSGAKLTPRTRSISQNQLGAMPRMLSPTELGVWGWSWSQSGSGRRLRSISQMRTSVR